MKVVINSCYGGFSLSKKAVYWLADKGHAGAKKEIEEQDAHLAKWGSAYPESGDTNYLEKAQASRWSKGDCNELMSYSWHPWDDDDLPRHHPLLSQCVEELGDAADGGCANLRVVEIPDGIDYEISEYDGIEHIAEKHRTWR